jgi:hypothetical protein
MERGAALLSSFFDKVRADVFVNTVTKATIAYMTQ